MVPGVFFSAEAIPSEPLAPVPPGAFHALALPNVHSDSAVLLRYLVKLSVVPDSSDRCTVWIAVSGSVAPLLSAAIFGSFHLVIVPEKMPARVAGARWGLSP